MVSGVERILFVTRSDNTVLLQNRSINGFIICCQPGQLYQLDTYYIKQ